MSSSTIVAGRNSTRKRSRTIATRARGQPRPRTPVISIASGRTAATSSRGTRPRGRSRLVVTHSPRTSSIRRLPAVVVVAGSSVTVAALRSAIDRGVRRLEASSSGACWTGFPTLAGRSEVWVTAFIVAHLQDIAPRVPILAKARRFLAEHQQTSGGWGYGGRGVPADADSTAWCLAALRASRSSSGKARARARTFLEAHRTDRGFATYRPDSGIREFIRMAG